MYSAAAGEGCRRRLWFRRRLGDMRRVLELVGVVARQSLEALQVLAAKSGAQCELLGQRIDRLVAAVELVVQMRPGRHAGRADKADHLALAHRHARLDARTETRQVAIASADLRRVLQSNVEAVAAIGPGHLHLARAGGKHRRSGWRAEVDTRVHRAVAQDRMLAHAEARGDVRGVHRRAQEGAHYTLALRAVE